MKNKRTKIFFLIAIFNFFQFVDLFAQQSLGGVPIGLKRTFNRMASSYVFLPTVDNSAEVFNSDAIYSGNCVQCKNNSYYGKVLDVNIDIKNQGQLEVLEDGSKLWLLNVVSSTAFGMQFYFDRYRLPQNSKLFFYNADTTMVLGAFSDENNPIGDSAFVDFGTQWIKGGNITIEYYEPANSDFLGDLNIFKLVHIFKDVFSERGPFGISGECNVNVACPYGFGWKDEISSVALILAIDNSSNYAAHCSGALINNTSEDGRPFFLTANHCIDDIAFNAVGNNVFNASSWTFLFNHQTNICNSDGSEVSQNLAQSVFGSFILSHDAVNSPNSDYLLLELNTTKDLLASYGVCYSGWSINSTPQAPYTGIHHPSGDVKKISVEYDPLHSTNYNSIAQNPSYNHWKVNDWDIGTTEGGSSGSPLFDRNHKIIGQLHGGAAGCNGGINNGQSDWYGKFLTSWQVGGFSYWLDPLNTGQSTISSYCPSLPNGGGGNAGGGGANNNCGTSYYRDGFLINNKENNFVEVCLDEGIRIEPTVKEGCSYGFLHVGSEKIKVRCSDINQVQNHDGCYSLDIFNFNCRCWIYPFFVAITECDANLNPIGQEFSEWKNLNISFSFLPQSFQLMDYLPQGIVLAANKFYKIKIAVSDYNGWDEGVKFIHTFSTNINISNVLLSVPIYSHDIVLEEVTVNNNIEVVAKNRIEILPLSQINAGTYKIENVECVQFREVQQPLSNSIYTENGKDANFNLLNKEKIICINTNLNPKALVIPNPSDGVFNIKISDNRIIKCLYLYDLRGILITEKISVNISEISMDVTQEAKGIYYLKVIDTENNFYVQKIINQ